MRLITCDFDYPDSRAPGGQHGAYAELARVFRASVARNMPGVAFREIKMPVPQGLPGKRTAYTSNTAKLRVWEKVVRAADEPLILADADMLCLRSVADAFEIGETVDDYHQQGVYWDIAYTRTSNPRLPLNGGLLFVRPTDAAKRFFRRWREVDLQMYRDAAFHEPWRRKTCGMNQASFWYLHEREASKLGVRLLALPCREWNACQDDWRYVDSSTRMLHVKGVLRSVVLGTPAEVAAPRGKGAFSAADLERCARIWREYA